MRRVGFALPLLVLAVGCTPTRPPDAAQGVPPPTCAPGTTWDGFECVKRESEMATGPSMAVASASVSALPSPPQTPDEILYQEAMERHAADDATTMRKKLFEVIQKYPTSARVGDAYFWFGELFFEEAKTGNASRFELAKAAFEHALTYTQAETAPDNLLHLAMTYDALGNAKECARTYSALRTQHPQSTAAHLIPPGH
ncbi:MAG: tetratricopeptide repeat protein [Polyangiaceae bacterium]